MTHKRPKGPIKFGPYFSIYLTVAMVYGTWEIFSDLTRWVF